MALPVMPRVCQRKVIGYWRIPALTSGTSDHGRWHFGWIRQRNYISEDYSLVEWKRTLYTDT